jgi:hypothetical protein
MGSSCELIIRIGIFEGIGCGTYGTFLLSAIVFAILGLAAFHLRLKWLFGTTPREQRSPLPRKLRNGNACRIRPEGPVG